MRRTHRLGMLALTLASTAARPVPVRAAVRSAGRKIETTAEPGHTYQARVLLRDARAGHATCTLKFSTGHHRTLRRARSKQMLGSGLATLVAEATAPERAAHVSVHLKLRRGTSVQDFSLVDVSSPGSSGSDLGGKAPAGADGAEHPRGDIYVSPNGSDANNGRARGSALRTIQSAIDRATSGDVIVVGAGVYAERVRLRASAVTLAGEPGATIDGGDDAGAGSGVAWTFEGDNTWAARLGYRPYNMTWDRDGTGNFVYVLRSSGALVPHDSPTSCCEGSGDAITDPAVIADIVPASFRADSDGTTHVRFARGEDPRRESLRFARQSDAALEVAGDGNTVMGLTVENASYGILVSAGAGNVIEHDTVIGGFHSIQIDGASVTGTQLRYNRITLNFTHTMDATDPYHWYVWNLVRNFSQEPRVGIAILESGTGNRIHHNLIYEHFTGIHHTPLNGVASAPVQDGAEDVRAYGRDLEIAYNRMENLGNDGVLLAGAEIGTRIHHNVVRRQNAGVRMFGPSDGPLYVYANHFESPPGYRTVSSSRYPGGRAYSFGAIFMYSESLAQMYVYHDAITAGTCYDMGSNWIGSQRGTPRRTGVPNAWYIDNDTHCASTIGHDSSEWAGSDGHVVNDWTGDPLPDFDAAPIGAHDLDELGTVP